MPRPIPVLSPSAAPDLRLRFEFVPLPDVPNKQEILAFTLGRAVFDMTAKGLYLSPHGPARPWCRELANVEPITDWPARLTTVVCTLGSSKPMPEPQVWVFRRAAMTRRAHPWEFADACSDRIASILEATPHMRPSSREPLYDRYISGTQDISYLDLLGRIAYQARRERVPQDETQLARAICLVGNTITTAVTGRAITPVGFSVLQPGTVFAPTQAGSVV